MFVRAAWVEEMSMILKGVARGLLATGAMTFFMALVGRLLPGKRLGPAAITDAALGAADANASSPVRNVLTGLAHTGFGVSLGVLYCLLDSGRAGRTVKRVPRVVKGIAFAHIVWVVSYAGWIPLLSILPPPAQDDRRRGLRVYLAHWVYGAVLGAS